MRTPSVIVVNEEDLALRISSRLGMATEVPLDVESNGLHAYRAITCTVQLGIVANEAVEEVAVLDPIVGGPAILSAFRDVFGERGPVKIVHDLAFDARMLARAGAPLGNVFDTSLAARFLGVTSTSLASLVQARLGVTLSKHLQHHDWGKRPLGEEVHEYLAADVVHLPALARLLRAELAEKGIAEEVDVETRYRLSTALVEEDDARPPYARIKGAIDLDPPSLAVLRAVAMVRERAADQWDVPPFKVIGNDVLFVLAKKKPTTLEAVRATRGLDRGRGAALTGELLDAIRDAVSAGDVPADERAAFFTPRPPPARALIDARRGREHRLSAFRRAEAKRRGVDEQVVLPGHCLQDLADLAPSTLEVLATVGGIGTIRVERYGAALLSAIAGSGSQGVVQE
jgi:ribonuclease D